MDGAQRINDLIGPVVAAKGYEIVRVLLMGTARPTLQVMIEPTDGHPMTVDDCADVSRAISVALDAADPIEAAYALEVTSPGIDRPLTRPKDFERFAGCEAKVEVGDPVGGRKRFQGRLGGLSGDSVRIELPDGPVELPLAGIRKAKLVLTDELLAAASAGQA